MIVSDVSTLVEEQENKQQSLWAKIEGSRWYAIPPALAESFLKAGAQVCQAEELPH
ncbi:hypothetical protein [Pseudoduganella sp. HUAS MS19]